MTWVQSDLSSLKKEHTNTISMIGFGYAHFLYGDLTAYLNFGCPEVDLSVSIKYTGPLQERASTYLRQFCHVIFNSFYK
jgi:hypothetical protein